MDADYGGSDLDVAHVQDSSANLAKAALDGIGGLDTSAFLQRLVAKTGDEVVDVVALAGDSFRVVVLEAAGLAAHNGDWAPGPGGRNAALDVAGFG